MPRYTERLERLLQALGTTYEQALLERSTYRYWTSFHAIEPHAEPAPTATIAIVARRSDRHVHDLQRAGHARTPLGLWRPRYCPQCLRDDLDECGETYWHRSHQLPLVDCCHKHGIWLTNTCHACGSFGASMSERRVALPWVKCPCGADLRRSLRGRRPAAGRVRLAQLSAEFLSLKPGTLNRSLVRANVKRLLAERGWTPHSKANDQIQRTLGNRYEALASAHEGGLNAPWTSSPSGMAAPQFCAMLVAMDLDFESSVRELSRPVADGQWRTGCKPRSRTPLDDAKEILRQCVATFGRQALARRRRAYWRVRLLDPGWLEQYTLAKVPPSPSIASDRANLRATARKGKQAKQLRQDLAMSAPGLRAHCRDEAWFNAFISKFRVSHTLMRTARRAARRKEQAERFGSLIEAELSTAGRPQRLKAWTLGALMGLTLTQAQDLVRATPTLRKSLDEANRTVTYRQILWAASELVGEGMPLSGNAIAARARVPRTRENNLLVNQVLAIYESERTAMSKRIKPHLARPRK